MTLSGKTVVVTGGTRGLGRGVAEALAEQGAQVVAVARGGGELGPNIRLITADITDKAAAGAILEAYRPDILVLNAGAEPPMAPLDQIEWADFTATWETDVKGGLYWMQAALNLPLAPGSRVLVTSSGAALQGSPLSGGYGGAKKMLWLMASYANGVSTQRGLGVQFQVLVPRQMVAGTGVGGAGSRAYAEAMGITPEAFIARFGAPMSPQMFGDEVVHILTDPARRDGFAFGLKADTGVTVLEDAAA